MYVGSLMVRQSLCVLCKATRHPALMFISGLDIFLTIMYFIGEGFVHRVQLRSHIFIAQVVLYTGNISTKNTVGFCKVFHRSAHTEWASFNSLHIQVTLRGCASRNER